MKKTGFLFAFLFFFPYVSFAVSNPTTDHTLIDCITGDDATGVAFDSAQPYQTLKAGIEETISYINTNINTAGNEATASGMLLNIRVKCSANSLVSNNIDLNFQGTTYNNELVIEGIGDNGLIINNTRFYQLQDTGNITFRNAKFRSAPGYYFYNQMFTSNANRVTPNDFGIKILDSSIELNNSIDIGTRGSYKLYYYVGYPGYYSTYRSGSNLSVWHNSYYHYSNSQNIQNSIIDIFVNADYAFRLPLHIKDSQIRFINTQTGSTHNISLTENGNAYSSARADYAVLASNQIDFGGNNVTIENDEDIAFVNNDLKNFSSLNISGNTLFLNNTIHNSQAMDISSMPNVYNNSFLGALTDTSDPLNRKYNYGNAQTGARGIGWILRRNSPYPNMNIRLSSVDIFRAITGTSIPNIYDNVYMIFQK